MNDRVLPFFEEEQGISLLRVLTDRGTEYCGNPERHEYELYLAVEDIDHSRTKTKSPQTNGIVERFHKTALTVVDLGSRGRDGPARSLEDRCGRAGLLLRSAKPVAARHQREHQRAAATVLSERHRSQHPQRPGDRRRGRGAQRQTPKDARLENARRGA